MTLLAVLLAILVVYLLIGVWFFFKTLIFLFKIGNKRATGYLSDVAASMIVGVYWPYFYYLLKSERR